MGLLLVFVAAALMALTLGRLGANGTSDWDSGSAAGARVSERWWREQIRFGLAPEAVAPVLGPAPTQPIRSAAQAGGAVLALALALECSFGGAAAAAQPALLAPDAAPAGQDVWSAYGDELARLGPQDVMIGMPAGPAAWTTATYTADGWFV